MELAIAIAVFGLILLFALLFSLSRGEERDQSQQMLERMSQAVQRSNQSGAIIRTPRPRDELLGALFDRINLMRKLEEHIWQAGLTMRVSEALLVMLLLWGAGAAAGRAWLGGGATALLTGVALSALPVWYIRFRRRRRLRQFAEQFPEVLDLLRSSLQAGHSLVRGLQVVVEEFADPVSSEFRMVLELVRLGVPLPRALEDILKRVPEESVRFLLVAVRVQSEAGSSLAEVIHSLAETIRDRMRVQLQIKTLTAQPRLSGMIVGLLPVFVLIAFSFVQPSYADTLLYDPLGKTLLKAAIGMDLTAFLVIRKVLQLDF